jgi:hypothetical protein
MSVDILRSIYYIFICWLLLFPEFTVFRCYGGILSFVFLLIFYGCVHLRSSGTGMGSTQPPEGR